jgi:hypothetical protein
MKIYLQADENGDITTVGEAPLAGALEVEAPADFAEFSIAKYVVVGDALAVRQGWQDPEPEA